MAKRKRTERQKIGVGVGIGIGIGVEKEIGMALLGQRGYAVHEETEEYRTNQIDPDAIYASPRHDLPQGVRGES